MHNRFVGETTFILIESMVILAPQYVQLLKFGYFGDAGFTIIEFIDILVP